MILFWSAMALSLIAAVVCWKIGQREPRPMANGPSELRHGVFLLLFSFCIVSQTYFEWADLGSAISHLPHASPSDLTGYLADAEQARRRLVMGAIVSTIVVSMFATQVVKITKAFMRRLSEKSAKPQETHA